MTCPDPDILAFYDAASAGELASMQTLYRGSPEPYDIWGITPLHCAAISGHLDVCQWLAEKGFYIHARDLHNTTPIINAAYSGNAALVIWLASSGANIHSRNAEGLTPLGSAVDGESVEVCRALLDLGANPNELCDDHAYPLHYAAARGNDHLIDLLISRGADPNQYDLIGYAPIHCAAWHRHASAVQKFLSYGVNVNLPVVFNHRCGSTPLLLAAGSLATTSVKILLAAGADPRIHENWPEVFQNEVGKFLIPPTTTHLPPDLQVQADEVMDLVRSQARRLDEEECLGKRYALFKLADREHDLLLGQTTDPDRRM